MGFDGLINRITKAIFLFFSPEKMNLDTIMSSLLNSRSWVQTFTSFGGLTNLSLIVSIVMSIVYVPKSICGLYSACFSRHTMAVAKGSYHSQ